MKARTGYRLGLAVLPVLVVGALAACGQDGQPVGGATPGPTTPAPTTPAPPSPTTPAKPVLGPAGYGALHLGMTRAQAAATGLTTGIDPASTEGCGAPGDGRLAGSPTSTGEQVTGRLFFGHGGKLVAIYAYPGVKTPEGVGPGDSYAQLHAAYPAWKGLFEPNSGRGNLPLAGSAKSHYRIVVLNDKVAELSLDSDSQDCYE